MDQSSKPTALNTIAVFSLFIVSTCAAVILPALSAIITVWQDSVPVTTIYMLSTLPTLMMIPAMLGAGAIAGKKISYKMLALIGSILATVFGCLPAIMTSNFVFILVCRALLGIGVGMVYPLGNALILGLYEPKTANSYLGYGVLIGNAAGVIFNYLGGFLSVVSWSAAFWGHALCAVTIVFCLFIKEPAKAEVAAGSANASDNKTKGKIDPFVWIAAILIFILSVINYPTAMNISVWMVGQGIGDAVGAATAMSGFTIFGCVAGFIFGRLFSKLGRFTITAGLVVAAAGDMFLRFGANTAMMTVGFSLIGLGYSMVMPAFMAYIGMRQSADRQPTAIAIVLAFMSVGTFFSSYYLLLVQAVSGEYLASEFIWAAVGFCAIGALFLFYNPAKKALAAATPASESASKPNE